ncbi:MAG: hypothetical protein U0575_12030 [Phycisphaerales bacterium]
MNRTLARLAVLAFASFASACSMFGGSGQAGSNPAAPAAAVPASGAASTKRPLLLLACLDDPAFYAAVRSMNLNAARCFIVYQSSGESNGRYDEAKLRTEIAKVVPADGDPFAMLDFEGEWTDYLKKTPGSAEFVAGQKALLRLLQVAHEVRPGAKWAMYGVPGLPFFVTSPTGSTVGWDKGSDKSKEEQFAIGRRAQPVVDASDWVSPSIYSPYLLSTNPEWTQATPAYSTACTKLAVEMAKGKPVIPMVWHRVHDSNQRDGLKVLPDDQFLNGQVKPALAAGAVGVAWWGADDYFAGVGKLPPVQLTGVAAGAAAAAPSKANQPTHQQIVQVHIDKLNAMKQIFQQ